MYSNIGYKIKGLALGTAIVGAIGAIITGILLIADDEDLIPVGLLSMFVGPIVSWVFSWVLYGFGELIDTASGIKSHIAEECEKIGKIGKTKKLTLQGLISEEEYQIQKAEIISKF